ncbi:hypothetical protein SANA_23140 [Gottschalkiaceae bacterium SANA]|nr:hypothetical protein SANA_23140 [Gottschalkiaceae bacterium SANA]
MNDKLNERKVERPKIKEQMKIDQMIVPCLVILIIMLVMIGVMQHNLIGEYQESVAILDDSNAFQSVVIENLRTENRVLRESVSFSAQTLEQIDLAYIQTIPEGVDLRIQLALQALGGE